MNTLLAVSSPFVHGMRDKAVRRQRKRAELRCPSRVRGLVRTAPFGRQVSIKAKLIFFFLLLTQLQGPAVPVLSGL